MCGYRAAVRLNYLLCGGQAQPAAVRPRGIVSVENTRQLVGRDAATGITYTYYGVFFLLFGSYHQLSAVVHSLLGVDKEIQYGLF